MNFKDKVLPWLKLHWLVLVLGVVAIAALPTALYFSASMNKQYVDEFQSQVTKDWDSVTKAKNAYYLQDVAGQKILEKSSEYNSELTQWYSERWKDIQSKTGAVWEEGLKFNRGQHTLLMEGGLFPAPPEIELKVRTRQLVGLVIEKHTQILQDARAGSPPDAGQMAAQLSEFRQAALARIQAERGVAPDKAEMDKLTSDLLDQRLSRYRARAGEIGVYAEKSAFVGIPVSVPVDAPSLTEAWDLQERTWLNQDLMRAVRLANSESSVPDSIVKRVIRIQATHGGYDAANPQALAFDAGEELAPLDFSRSVTGRVAGPGSRNKWFDLRLAQMEIVVSSQRLPAFINALAATNFISVLDVQLAAADPLQELRAGYYYGEEHVVRATLTLETLWLREWRKDWMPTEVKRALAMDESSKGDPNAPGLDAPAPAPVPGGGRRAAPPSPRRD